MDKGVVSIDADFSQSINAFKAIRSNLKGLEPPMRKWGHYMVVDTQDQFRKGIDPDGNPWAPLSPVTLLNKAKLGYPPDILIATGDMERTVDYAFIGKGVVIRIGFPAQFHQRGTTKMPARIILGMNPYRQAKLGDIVKEFLLVIIEDEGLSASVTVNIRG
jgi:phage gpG-like protein